MVLKPFPAGSDISIGLGTKSVGKGTNMLSFWTTYFTTQLRARRGEEGASLVEYALLVALIAVVCIVAVALIGTNANKMFTTIAGSV
jgi:pilus assembly protein Flp/PilA